MSTSVSAFNALLRKRTAKESNDLFGNVFYKNHSGRRSLSSDEAIPYDAFFSCYSVSKPLTTISALQCVERGLIGLDDDLSGHLPELAQQPIISLAADDALSYELAKNSITLRHLLTHTSGLAYDGPQPLIARWRKETQGLPPMWKCGDLLLAYSTPRLFEAGESWQYGSGLEWAGLLVSRLNGGEPLGQYMEENIFRPLGATDSTFHPNGRPDLQKRRLEMVGRNSEGIFEPAPEHWIYPEDPKDDCGGLGLFSTVPDLIQVIGDLASTSPVLLKLDTIETMFTPHFEYHEGVNKGMVGMQYMYQNFIGEGALSEDGRMNVGFGLGGVVTRKDTVNLPKNTLTWGGMPHLAWFVNRDLGVAGLFASQFVPPGDVKSNSMIASFLQEIVRQARQKGSSK